MSNVVNRILTEQMGGRHAETFIGKPGEIFYDAGSGALRIGDGITPGGHSITESSPMESLFIGDWVYFERPADKPEIMDHISDTLILARSEGGLLYNAYDQENGYELNNPSNTSWNTDGWQDLSNVKERYYQDLAPSLSGGGWATVKHEWIMHDTDSNKYYAIRFLTWDSGNNYATGAFSYIRREINTAIYFKREDTNDEQTALENGDVIADNLIITRGNGQAIFNVALSEQLVWTNASSFDSATWDGPAHTLTFVNPTGDLLTGLLNAKTGDSVYLNTTSYGGISVQISGLYDEMTGILPIEYDPGYTDTITDLYINVPTLAPTETGYDEDQSPKGTLWNAEGHEDLSNLLSRQFILFDDLFAGQYLGKRIVGKELVMWNTENNKYYAITFTRWAQGNEYSYPGFSYTRREIDVNKLTSGLKFNDGTIQQTAYSEKVAGTIKRATKETAQVGDRYITPADIGKMIYLDGNTSNTLRLPDGGAYDFPIGATITIINRTGGTVYLYKENNDDNGTIYGAGTSDSSTGWQIPDAGGGNIATLIKIETGMDNYFNDWMLAGSGIQVD